MICPKCSYVMSAFDVDCPRCHGQGVPKPPATGTQSTSPQATIPSQVATPPQVPVPPQPPKKTKNPLWQLYVKISQSDPNSRPAVFSQWWEEQSNPLAQILGIVGSILLLLGLFAPVLHAPIVGTVSYLQFSNLKGEYFVSTLKGNTFGGASNLLAWCVAGSFFLSYVRIYNLLWYTGVVALVFTGGGYMVLQERLAQQLAAEAQQQQAGGNAFSGFSIAISVQPQWGWGLLILGPVLIIAAAVVAEVSAFSLISGSVSGAADFMSGSASVMAGISQWLRKTFSSR